MTRQTVAVALVVALAIGAGGVAAGVGGASFVDTTTPTDSIGFTQDLTQDATDGDCEDVVEPPLCDDF